MKYWNEETFVNIITISASLMIMKLTYFVVFKL